MNHTRWLLVKEAADYLRMNPDTVREKMRRKEIKAVKNGKLWRTTDAWCDEFLKGNAA